MSTVNASLNRLRELAPTLNKAADEAAEIVREVENLLTKELSIGIEAIVQVDARNLSPKKVRFKTLEHRRVDGKFRIAIVEKVRTEFVNDHSMPEYSWNEEAGRPWAESPRDEKLETFPFLPQLLEEIVKQVERTKERIEQTQETVKQIKERVDQRHEAMKEILGAMMTPETGEKPKPEKTTRNIK